LLARTGELIPPAEWACDMMEKRFRTNGIAKLPHVLNDLLDEKKLPWNR
jgi:hypothetical protein